MALPPVQPDQWLHSQKPWLASVKTLMFISSLSTPESQFGFSCTVSWPPFLLNSNCASRYPLRRRNLCPADCYNLCILCCVLPWQWVCIWSSPNLKHGEAYDYDLFLNGFFNCVNGCLGLPWLATTTVPCIIHLNSLAEKDKEGKFISFQETRLTMFFSHLMVGFSLLVLNWRMFQKGL